MHVLWLLVFIGLEGLTRICKDIVIMVVQKVFRTRLYVVPTWVFRGLCIHCT